MQLTIKTESRSRFGYVCEVTDNGGSTRTVELTRKTSDGYLYLPDNDLNWKMISIKSLKERCHDELVLEYKESRTRTESNGQPKKGLEEYLEGEDREMYLKLVEKARARKTELSKPMTVKQYYEKKVSDLEALIAKLQSEVENK